MIYLGMPLGSWHKTTSIWNLILERMEKKLLGWKRLYLSKGGRLTFLKSTLSSLPTYYLSLFTILKAVATRLERIQRNFLWGSLVECFKYPLVAWEKVCFPRELGGLGIRKLAPFNQALLGKWLWRYGHETLHLWRRIIAMKYGEGKGGWCTRACSRAHGCGLWSSISEGWETFTKHLSFVLGDGACILFWHDKWTGDVPLKILYPQLFLCSANKEACISEVLSPPVGDNDRVWSLRFQRDFNDWELADSYSFIHFIQTRIPRGGGCDKLCCDLNGSGKFDTWSFYHKIRNVAPSTFPWKGIWKVKVPKRVAFFMWTMAHGQILTLDNLMLRGRPLVNLCCLCCRNAVSVGHLLLFCSIAHSLWMYMLQLFGIEWVMPGSVVDLLFCWYHWLGKHSSDIWDLVLGCLMWIIWIERNRRSFEDEGKTLVQLLEYCQWTLFDWSCCWGYSDCSTLLDFLSSIRID